MAPPAAPACTAPPPTEAVRGSAGSSHRLTTRLTASVSALLLALAVLPLAGCLLDHGERAMRSWLADRDDVLSAEAYCTSYMELGCHLHTVVVLAHDTSAADASAFINGALTEATRDGGVSANLFSLELSWQYGSTRLEHSGVMFQPGTSEADTAQSEQAQALREELLSLATDLAEEDAESVSTHASARNESGLVEVERGEVDTLPTNLLAHTSLTHSDTVGLKDHFTLEGWDVQIHSSVTNEPPTDVVSEIVTVPLEEGTEPFLLLDTLENKKHGETEPVVTVRGLETSNGKGPSSRQAAPVLAAIMGTPVFSKVELCGAASGSDGYSCVFYDMDDGVVDRNGYPYSEAQTIYDRAVSLSSPVTTTPRDG